MEPGIKEWMILLLKVDCYIVQYLPDRRQDATNRTWPQLKSRLVGYDWDTQ